MQYKSVLNIAKHLKKSLDFIYFIDHLKLSAVVVPGGKVLVNARVDQIVIENGRAVGVSVKRKSGENIVIRQGI
jgi:hypothetical protein